MSEAHSPNIMDETELTRVVICKQRTYEVPKDVADCLASHSALVEVLKEIMSTALEKMDGDSLYVPVAENSLIKARELLRQAEEGK